MDRYVREQVNKRSGGLCEVHFKTIWGFKRCEKPATDIHHMITKARGGELLDDYTIHHLIHLCRTCHNAAQGQDAYDNGLLIDGRVVTDKLEDRPVYTGSDPELKEMFG